MFDFIEDIIDSISGGNEDKPEKTPYNYSSAYKYIFVYLLIGLTLYILFYFSEGFGRFIFEGEGAFIFYLTLAYFGFCFASAIIQLLNNKYFHLPFFHSQEVYKLSGKDYHFFLLMKIASYVAATILGILYAISCKYLYAFATNQPFSVF